ncbi:hypothetical protein I3842_03G083000 [Carya illinoinensis]|uniref:Uncharacterized protein n=1 Tax=Carya illinoinensis TaxID=32201 RepID=A0A922FE88_CARIL|nr:hypothetical protein I3842_03G083000 [Carya illinoinensis]
MQQTANTLPSEKEKQKKDIKDGTARNGSCMRVYFRSSIAGLAAATIRILTTCILPGGTDTFTIWRTRKWRLVTVVDRALAWMTSTTCSLQHPAYVRVRQQLQIQLLQLEQAFLQAAIALETGVALNKDSSATTICVEEYYQHHTQHYCQNMYPTSLRVMHLHLISSTINSLICTQYSGLLSS